MNRGDCPHGVAQLADQPEQVESEDCRWEQSGPDVASAAHGMAGSAGQRYCGAAVEPAGEADWMSAQRAIPMAWATERPM